MSTSLFPSPIFGPVHSRRLGLSLGINLLPEDRKICSFNCIYCECGLNEEHRSKSPMPTRQAVNEALEKTLQKMKVEGKLPDTLTFAGNGEPTSHRDFLGIILDTILLRNHYCPNAKISVLTNASHILKDNIFQALKLVDNALLKLDTVNLDYIRRVNVPKSHYDLDQLIARMIEFEGKCIIQTMFLTGTHLNQSVDNTTDDYVDPWLKTLSLIAPKAVTIYTIDRDTPSNTLKKASKESLDQIAQRVRALGFECSVSY